MKSKARIGIIGILIAIALLMVLGSCRPCKDAESTVITKDSLVVKTEIKYRDTIVKIPGDSVRVTMYVNCDSTGKANMPKVSMRSGKSHFTAEIKNGVAKFDCTCKQTEINLLLKEIQNTRLEKRVKEMRDVIYKKQPLSRFQKFFFITGIIAWVIILVAVAIFCTKFFNQQ